MRQGGRGSVSLSEAEGVVQSRFLAYRGGVENSIFLLVTILANEGGTDSRERSRCQRFDAKVPGGRRSLRYRPSSVLSGASKVGSHLSQACTTILLGELFKTRSTPVLNDHFFSFGKLGKVKWAERKLSERAVGRREKTSRGRVRRNTTAHRVSRPARLGIGREAVESLMRRFERGIGGAVEA